MISKNNSGKLNNALNFKRNNYKTLCNTLFNPAFNLKQEFKSIAILRRKLIQNGLLIKIN